MDERDQLSHALADALRTIDFEGRYYGFYEKIKSHVAPSHLNKRDWESALGETGLTFRYHSRERFFSSDEKAIGKCTAWLNVAFSHDQAEFILNLMTPAGGSGGPFALLAYSSGLSRDQNFAPDPPYPTLPFTNREQLREVIRFGMELYADIERVLRSCGMCGNEE
jgi:hypothetical protein